MTGVIDWAASRARMIFAFVALSIAAGTMAYLGLPKEGEPDIDIPVLFVSVPFPGISAADAERLIVKPLEQELGEVDNVTKTTAYATEGHAGVILEFNFDWNKTGALAEVRDAVDKAEAKFPSGYEKTQITEINTSSFPILVVSLSGDTPERTLLKVAKDLQDRVEAVPEVLEAGLAGHRDEMLEVVIDPLKLEAYDVTGQDLISVVTNNNRLVAAGAVETGSGQFAVKLPASFEDAADVYALPVKVNGDRIVTIGDIADIRLTFEDAQGTARFNGRPSVSLQVVKRKGMPVIETVDAVKAAVAAEMETWPEPLRESLQVDYSMDESKQVASMVSQLEGSVLTAIALVMIVVLSSLGLRSALLVGFSIPTSFLLCFGLIAIFGMSINNIVMFGLILAVGMLVDGAIVVVEYADQRIREGEGPMRAYVEAAKRMFWPVVSSTATTLCAFLPMLFWPGIAGEFMSNLPITLIFVLSASLVVALIYLPVVGGVAGRLTRWFDQRAAGLQARTGRVTRGALFALSAAVTALAIYLALFPPAPQARLVFVALAVVGWLGLAVLSGSFRDHGLPPPARAGYRRTPFGHFIRFLTGNPVMPFVAIAATVAAVGYVMAVWYPANGLGTAFFVNTEPERAIVYVRARGNLSLAERDRLLNEVERDMLDIEGVESVFAFAGDGGLQQRGNSAPKDTVGRIQIEFAPWGDRPSGSEILAEIDARASRVPGVIAEVALPEEGPQQGKPVQLRLRGDDWEDLLEAARVARDHLDAMPGLTAVEDTRPLPGIDWRLDVDVERAGRFGADVSQIGPMVSLITRGILLDTMRPDNSEDEIDIRVRYPEKDRVISTLDDMRLRTAVGLVPLENFVTREPARKLGEINRFDGRRFFDVKADVAPGVNANAEIAKITEWIEADAPFPASVEWSFTGDQETQAESEAFLARAFLGALGLMFVILLAQFNSLYNSALVLTAVVMSVAGVMVGLVMMGHVFSIIMTGTGIVALAGIVVNNNIVLIDTYQEFKREMPELEAITRTAEARIRPVLLTTITTIAGLTPMMFGISVDFFGGGYTLDAPSALWWKNLSTAVVFGLGSATVLTLIFTPAALAARVWIAAGAARALGWSQDAKALARLRREARRTAPPELVFAPAPPPAPPQTQEPPATPYAAK